MKSNSELLLSVVVPVHNERAGLSDFHKSLVGVVKKLGSYEIIYVEDGSTDGTADLISGWTGRQIRLIKLSRNFGKEVATSAGIVAARGQAIITLDSDGQHPVELIKKFVQKWQKGAKVVVGVRTAHHSESLLKRYSSSLFYKLFNRFTGMHLIPGSTDFRLIDRGVQREFAKMTERNRITRGLIDWLGYERDYIYFKASARLAGDAAYSYRKLLKLAVNSVVSLSSSPLYITAIIGAVVLPLSSLLGIFMLLNAALGDPARLHATGSAYAIVLILFLIGVLMMSQGIIGLYLSHIHAEAQNRPLYVVESEMGGDDEKT